MNTVENLVLALEEIEAGWKNAKRAERREISRRRDGDGDDRKAFGVYDLFAYFLSY